MGNNEKSSEFSSKIKQNCCRYNAELKWAIIDGIKWENIPWRSSPVLFKRLKDEIIKLKDEGRVLLRFNELREMLELRMSSFNAQPEAPAQSRVVTQHKPAPPAGR